MEKKNKLVMYLASIITYMMAFAIMFKQHYSRDSYSYYESYLDAYKGNLSLGRVGNYIVQFLFRKINIIDHEKLFVFMLIVVLGTSTFLIFEKYKMYLDDNKLLKFGIWLTIVIMYCNFFMVDFFQYIEMAWSWCFGISMITLSVWLITPKMTIKRTLLIIFTMYWAVSFYQALLGYFIFFGLIFVYIVNNGELSKSSFWDSFKVVLCGGAAAILNVAVLKVMQLVGIAETTGRTGSIGIEGVISNVKVVNDYAKWYFTESCGLYPKNAVRVVVIVLYALVLFEMILSKRKVKEYVYIALVVLCCRGALYAPQWMASYVWVSPRSIISYFSIIAIPAVFLLINTDKNLLRNIGVAVVGFSIVLNVISIQTIAANIVATNVADEEVTRQIQYRIEQYEAQTGETVDTIVWRNDIYPTWGYPSVGLQVYEIDVRMFTADWSCVQGINYYTGRNYSSQLMDDDTYNRMFEGANWDCLDLEQQMVIDGNVAYIVMY